MSRKVIILIGMTVGGYAGGYIPVFFGAEVLSFTSILFNALGGFAGIWIAYKITS